MKNFRLYFLFAFVLGGLFSCETALFDEQDLPDTSLDVSESAIGIPFLSGCDLYINGSFENGSVPNDDDGTAAFSKNRVDRWGSAFGTADNWVEYEGVSPFSGNKLAHMRRYKGYPEHYEAIFLDIPLKTKNSYDLDYRMRGGDLRMEVYVFDEIETVDINSIIPHYVEDLGDAGFIRVGLGYASGDSWKLRTHSFSLRSGRLVFIPQSATFDNPNRMLLDKVQLNCEYGYLDEIYADIINTTAFGYEYQFDTEISEDNPDLDYLWTFNYWAAGFQSEEKSPKIEFPFPQKSPYTVEACVEITDRDGCCVEKCIEFEIGSYVVSTPETPDSICNYYICLDDLLTLCGENGDLYILGGPCLTCDDEVSPEDILDETINGWIQSEGYDKVNTSVIQTVDCQNMFFVECSPIPIAIGYECELKDPFESESTRQLKIIPYQSDCEVDCGE